MTVKMIFNTFDSPTAKSMGMDAVRMEMLNETRKIGREMRADLKQYVSVFDTPKPKIEMKIGLTRREPTASVAVYTEDERVQLLDKGTSSHFIAPVRARALSWRYRPPKTRPNSLKTRRTTYRGPRRYSKGHTVRGITPRNIGKTLAAKYQVSFQRRLIRAAWRGSIKARSKNRSES